MTQAKVIDGCPDQYSMNRKANAHQCAIARTIRRYPTLKGKMLHTRYLDICPAYITQETFEKYLDNMTKAKVIDGCPDQYPPVGSVGTAWTVATGQIAFVPDDPAHLPPGCSVEAFGYYLLNPHEVKVLSTNPDEGVDD